jgi:hypothetical protein
MNEYEVVGSRPAQGRLTLLGTDGQYHQIRALSQLPPVGAVLVGARPHLGFGILLSTQTGNICPVIFEKVNQRVSVRPA